jgi:DUF4097 and DUF4098 domain-containing protein YvlB
MIKTTKQFRGITAALLLLLGGALGAYAQGENESSFRDPELLLVNTVTLSLAEVKNLSIHYADDEVILRESGDANFVIREYMKRDKSQYYANVSRSRESVSIRGGRRPWFGRNWKAQIEISLPRSFRENLRISIASGVLRSEADLPDYKTIDVSISSGSVSYKRLAAETVSVRLSSGSLDIEGIEGNSFISISSGRLQIGALSGGEHRIKDASGRVRIGPIRGDSTIEISSGGIDLEGVEGNADIDVQSGTVQIGGLTGTNHRIRSSSGRIGIEKIRGGLEVHTSSGSVDIGDFSGEGSFELSSGDITLGTRELMGDLRFTVSGGNIHINLPREIPFNLDAITNGGRILVYDGKNEVIHVSGSGTVFRPVGASPERTLYARTSSGNVRIDLQN